MGTYDGYWDMNRDNQSHFYTQKKEAELTEYYVIQNAEGKVVSSKYRTEQEAIQKYVKANGRDIFTWQDFQAKGHRVTFVNKREVQTEIERLQTLLE